jgi:two-component system response regulator DctR
MSPARLALGRRLPCRLARGLRGCLLLDIRMGGMSGLRAVRPSASAAPPAGDLPDRPRRRPDGRRRRQERRLRFRREALQRQRTGRPRHRAMQSRRRAQARRGTGRRFVNTPLPALTPREREVMERILAGKLNKVIADELQISMRTVEVHRAQSFEKMGVRRPSNWHSCSGRQPLTRPPVVGVNVTRSAPHGSASSPHQGRSPAGTAGGWRQTCNSPR